MGGKPGRSGAPIGNTNNRKHGLSVLRAAATRIANRPIDGRSAAAKMLAKWRGDLVRDLGGDLSVQQECIVDMACKTKLLIDSVDAWLVVQRSLVNVKRRSLIPALRERQALADALVRYMQTLGLHRVSRDLTLDQMISSALQGDGNQGDGNQSDG